MSAITTSVKAFKDSGVGWEQLRDTLANRTYPKPERYSGPRDESNDLVAYTDGTWDEVRRCRNIGLLTDDQYMEIVKLADARK